MAWIGPRIVCTRCDHCGVWGLFHLLDRFSKLA
jgi:hypothetical protein